MSLVDRMLKEQAMGSAIAASDPSSQAFWQGELNRYEMKEQMDRLIAAQKESAASSRELSETKAALDESMKAVRHLREQLQIANKSAKWNDAEAEAGFKTAGDFGERLGMTRTQVTQMLYERRDAILRDRGQEDLINDRSFRE